MSTNNIFCFGDGFAHGHIWPEWPQLLEAMMPEHRVIVISGIGAGPEYLVTQFSKMLPISGTVIFQWPKAERFDKLIEDQHWLDTLNQDPVYHFNTYKNDDELWWLSSQSTMPDVVEYHQKFIQPQQAQLRLTVYQQLVQEILEKTQVSYYFTSTEQQDRISRQHKQIRGTEIQPTPLSHWYFLTEYIMPALNLHSKYADKLKNLLEKQNWVPYDPDRAEIWHNIKVQLYSSDK